MCNSNSLELNFKIGVINELYKRELITEHQIKNILKILIDNENEKIMKGAKEK